MKYIDPKAIPTAQLHQLLLGAVSPRPIAFVSSIAKDGTPNLAPYSFFNVFSSNPPIMVFSSNRRVADNTTKDTLQNIIDTREAVVNIVNYDIVQQMSITSIQYPPEISEFAKSGLTPLPSTLVKPFRVKESHFQMECKVQDIITLGQNGGAGHLIICEMIAMHINPDVLNEQGKIDPGKADNVGRMGRAFYCRASGPSVFPLYRAGNKLSIGFDQIPSAIRTSKILSGNDLAQLAAVLNLPSEDEIESVRTDERVMNAIAGNAQDRELHLHTYAKELIQHNNIEKAWKVLLI